MIARVDGKIVSPDTLWWPTMNFGQFRWEHPIGNYELELPWVEFAEHLEDSYHRCTAELKADDLLVPNQSPCLLRDSGYPPFADLPNHPAALLEALRVYLWDNLFITFLPCPPGEGCFMVNSIDGVLASSSVVIVQGRGYHASRD